MQKTLNFLCAIWKKKILLNFDNCSKYSLVFWICSMYKLNWKDCRQLSTFINFMANNLSVAFFTIQLTKSESFQFGHRSLASINILRFVSEVNSFFFSHYRTTTLYTGNTYRPWHNIESRQCETKHYQTWYFFAIGKYRKYRLSYDYLFIWACFYHCQIIFLSGVIPIWETDKIVFDVFWCIEGEFVRFFLFQSVPNADCQVMFWARKRMVT